MTTKHLIHFSDRHTHYTVCFVDIVDSSKIATTLTGKEVDVLYATFLNTLASVIIDKGGVVIKTLGDALLYYFPETDFGTKIEFDEVLSCGFAVLAARDSVNQQLVAQRITPISYRVSASYGPVSIAEDEEGDVEDLFGSTVNTCAKINRRAQPNGLVIGSGLYEQVKDLPGYDYENVGDFELGAGITFPLYAVTKRTA